MKHFWNLISGFFICLLFLIACDPQPSNAALLQSELPVQAAKVSYSLYDIVRLILATFGGVATTILLTFLKAKYPKLFGALKIPADDTQKPT